jgi:hypothetical protein
MRPALRKGVKRVFALLPLALRRHLLFVRSFGHWGNFRTPQTYSEKLNWRAINDRRAMMAFTADKLAAKEYVRRTLARNPLKVRTPETYWVGTDLRELRTLAARLPARWVLKPNHSCGRVQLIDSTHAPIDWDQLAIKTANWTERDEEYTVRGHWAYGQARRLLIAEERIGAGEHAPDDLKIEGYQGEPAFTFWTTGRSSGAINYSNLKMDQTRLIWGHSSESAADAPIPLEELDQGVRAIALALASELSAPFDHLRVDGYAVDGEYWFGEITTYPAAGLGEISRETDTWLGSIWRLPDLSAADPRDAEWRALLEGTPKGTLQQ